LKFSGQAIAELPGDAQMSWSEASTLGWLKGYDKVARVAFPKGSNSSEPDVHLRAPIRADERIVRRSGPVSGYATLQHSWPVRGFGIAGRAKGRRSMTATSRAASRD